MWWLPCQQHGMSLFSLSGALCEFSLGLAEYECPLVWLAITLPPAYVCVCVCVFFPALKTWTMMTQATQSTPQGKYSRNKNNKWIFDCSQMWEEAYWHWAKSLSRSPPHPTQFIRLGCLVFRKCWKALQIVSAQMLSLCPETVASPSLWNSKVVLNPVKAHCGCLFVALLLRVVYRRVSIWMRVLVFFAVACLRTAHEFL